MRNWRGHVVKALSFYSHNLSPNPDLDSHYLDLVVLNFVRPLVPKNKLVAFLDLVFFSSAIALIRFVAFIQA